MDLRLSALAVAAQSSHAAPSRPAGLNPPLGPEEKRRGTSLLYRDLGPTAALGSSPARDAAVACVHARSTGFMEFVDAKIREPTGAHDGTGLMMQHKEVLQAVKMSQSILDGLRHPIVQAPMAGGVSTPALAAAVSRAGGLGFLAAGYKTVDEVERDLAAVRSLLPAGVPYGLNLFAPPGHGAGVAEINSYADRLREEAQERGVALGNPRWDDDWYSEKLDLLGEHPVPVVSLTFGCPTQSQVDRLHASGSAVWVTVTTVEEARAAQRVGADGLVVQGVEAGGHRGGFDDTHPGDIGLLALLQLVLAAAVNHDLPLIAAGGLTTGRSVAAVLAAGAAAAQLGTAFMLCPEAGTVPAHRDAIGRADALTALTRAFTGRTARGIINRFLQDHSDAPSAYPEVHHLTAPLRTTARTRGDIDCFHLWAGQTYSLAEPLPAADLVVRLGTEAREALEAAKRTVSGQGFPITGPA